MRKDDIIAIIQNGYRGHAAEHYKTIHILNSEALVMRLKIPVIQKRTINTHDAATPKEAWLSGISPYQRLLPLGFLQQIEGGI